MLYKRTKQNCPFLNPHVVEQCLKTLNCIYLDNTNPILTAHYFYHQRKPAEVIYMFMDIRLPNWWQRNGLDYWQTSLFIVEIRTISTTNCIAGVFIEVRNVIVDN